MSTTLPKKKTTVESTKIRIDYLSKAALKAFLEEVLIKGIGNYIIRGA